MSSCAPRAMPSPGQKFWAFIFSTNTWQERTMEQYCAPGFDDDHGFEHRQEDVGKTWRMDAPPVQRSEIASGKFEGVRVAIEQAVKLYGGAGSEQEGVFNLAGLSAALMAQAGLRGVVDGRLCRVILADRNDVEEYGPSDCYRRMKPREG